MEAEFNPSDLTTKTVVETKAEQKQEYKLIGSMRIPRGMKLFAFNIDTQEMKEVVRTPIDTANYTDAAQHKKDIGDKKTKTMHDARSFYIIAINKKNAYRKFRLMVESKMPPK